MYNLHLSGAVREMIYFNEVHETMIILECADKAEAELLLADFPIVKAELIRFSLTVLQKNSQKTNM